MAVKSVFNQFLDEVSTTAKGKLGDLRQENGKWYKYVMLKNVTATVACVAGDPVSYAEGVTLLGYYNNHVVADATDADAQPVAAGCVLATITGTAGTAYYIWIQIKGYIVVPTAVTSGVLGTDIMPATGDKTYTVRTGVIHGCGLLLSATAANNKVLLDCKF